MIDLGASFARYRSHNNAYVCLFFVANLLSGENT